LGSSRVDSSKHKFCYKIVATSSGAMSDDKDVSAHSANSVSMTLAAAAAAEATAQPETVSDSGEVDGNIW
jgi:hypothetical protein